jgi:hypothetical protein
MNRGNLKRNIVPVLLLAGVLLSAASVLMTGCSTVGPKQLVEDPEGRYSFELAGEDFVQIPTNGDYIAYGMASPSMELYVVAEEAASEKEGVDKAIMEIGRDPGALIPDGSADAGEWTLLRYVTEGSDIWTAIAYQYRGGTIYALFLEGGSDSSPDPPPRAVGHIIRTCRRASPRPDLQCPDRWRQHWLSSLMITV